MFKIGDKVEVINKKCDSYGWTGTILNIIENGEYKVNFSEGTVGIVYGNYKADELKLIPSPFTLKDLKEYDIGLLRDGREFTVIYNMIIIKDGGYLKFSDYNNDLKTSSHPEYDIMTVTRNGEVVFKREEKRRMEYEIDYYDKRENKHLNQYFKSQNELLVFLVVNQEYIEITQIHGIEIK